jgi:methionyl aminopeptidase
MAILIKTSAEIEKMRRSGEVLRQVHEAVRPLVVPGASTMDLENVAAAKMDVLHAVSAFKGYHGFPAVLCTSVNSEVVHGIPSPTRILADGDIVSIDCGVIVDGFYSDCAVTYAVGHPSTASKKLLDVTRTALENAIQEAQVGGRLGDISAAVQ